LLFSQKSSTFAGKMSKFSKFISSTNVQNVAKLLSANVVAQIVGLMVYPILTRIYAPEDFGLMNLFVSIASVLVILATAEYHYAIVLPKEDKLARGIVHLSIGMLLIVTIIVLLTLPFAKQIADLFNTPALAKMYAWLPLMVLFLGAWNILNYWYIRNKIYSRISAYLISQSTLSAGLKIGFGYAGWLQGGLIYSMILAPAISLVTSALLSFKRCIRPLLHIDKAAIRQAAITYRNFPLFTMPRSLVNVIAGQLPVLLLVPIFGTEQVGLLGMALLLGFAPISMITKAIYQVLYQHVTECVHTKKPIIHLLKRFIIGTTLVAVPVFAVLGIVLPELTSWLLGNAWYISGEYIRWMLPWLWLSLLTGSICFLSDVFMQQRIGFYFEVLLALCRVAGLLLGIWNDSFVWAIAAYAIGTTIAVAAQLIWLLTLASKYDKQLRA
jgi:O-antigen/teichoic acid export membrane protein